MRFTDKVCIVSGGGSGIGKATCLRLAREGGQIVVADIDDDGNETVKEIERAGGEAIFVKTDVSDSAQVQATVRAAVDKWQRIHVVVNDAAMMTFKPVVELPDEDWDKVLGVNLRSVFLFCKYAVRHMPHGGAIVNISSVHAHETTKNVVPYASSKGGMEAFTRGFSEGRVTLTSATENGDATERGENDKADNASASGENKRTLKAEQLVIALGSVPNFHDIPGVAQHSLTMKSLSDADAIRDHVLKTLERDDAEPDDDERRASLTFVVGGGGFNGVETMAAVNDLARTRVERHTRLKKRDVRALVVTPEGRLLPELTAELAAYAQRKLEARGVEVRLKTKITGAGEGYVELEGGERIRTRTLIWAGGVKPNPVVERLDCQHGRHGGIAVDECCRVHDRPGVWVLGDCAEIPKANSKDTYSPTAQNASREGVLVARNIVATLRGQRPKPFRYRPVGELALVGRHAGVARVYGFNFSGLAAWLLWRAVYWAKMPSGVQRVRILLDWLLDFAFGRPVAALPPSRQGMRALLRVRR